MCAGARGHLHFPLDLIILYLERLNIRYLGGKARQAKWIEQEILRLRGDKRIYLEPFIGGGSVLARVAPHFEFAIGSDIVPDLIELYQALQRGWIPPESLTKNEYDNLRHSEPSALRAWAAFAASYNGKYFSGYGPTASGRNYLAESKKAILRKAEGFRHVCFQNCSYNEHSPDSDYVVYCDPPYANTETYQGAPEFDHVKFWTTMDEWTDRGALVLVSEYEAPTRWQAVSSVTRVETMNHSGPSSGARQETLFMRK